MRKNTRLVVVVVFALTLIHRAPAQGASTPEDSSVVVIDATAPTHPLPHFWEQMFGSERAIVTLRESYRKDLRDVKKITGFEYVRFHAIFHDEVGVYDEDPQGRPQYNFSYVDQIYDGLLANGVRPLVELSFMPKKLAAREGDLHPFWYKQNVSPPKDWDKWDDLITAFTKHLVERYGIDEVAQWYFEVWNEPNIDFWAGEPKQATYWELYDHTARSIKQVSTRLRVGGPSTAQAAWADIFIRHCAENKVPVDFVSSHVYGNDRAQDVFGTDEKIPCDQMVCRAVKKVHDEIRASTMPSLPLIWTEYNASYFFEPAVTDSIYMGPWMADTIRQCDGLADMMSYWTFSDVFEEQGVVKEPFYGGFGLIAAGGIPKPSFNAFKLLHELGNERITVDSSSVLVTRKKDGSLVVAAWNLVPLDQTGSSKTIHLRFDHLAGSRRAYISRVDRDHGDVHPAYEKMGQPRYPSQEQLKALQQASQLPPAEIRELTEGELTLDLAPDALAVIEVK
ncbi:MAG: glycosyl hydrolase family 39 [Acidobacteriia bacterium]|nr:glycosyl hydrolase family 39 [Terriglobia bacterium]